MKFINKTEVFEIGVGDIIIRDEDQYMIVYSENAYKWVNLNNGYLSVTKYNSVSEVIEVFENAKVFKNNKFSLILNK